MQSFNVLYAPAPTPRSAAYAPSAVALSHLRFKTIASIAGKDRSLAREAMTLRRRARGPNKLARRLRRSAELGRRGAF